MTDKRETINLLKTRDCISCGLPFTESSMSGYWICPACDCGIFRDGTPWDWPDMYEEIRKENAKKHI